MKNDALNRVATLSILFWVIKIISTTVGETAADFVAVDMNLGLVYTTILMVITTIAVIFWNFKQKKYFPPSYWVLIVMISIQGTLITDLLVDQFGVSLLILDVIFSIAMIAVFYI